MKPLSIDDSAIKDVWDNPVNGITDSPVHLTSDAIDTAWYDPSNFGGNP